MVSLWTLSVLRQRSAQTKVLSKFTTTVWLPPFDQQNGNSVTFSLNLHCRSDFSHKSADEIIQMKTQNDSCGFRMHFMWLCVLFFISTSNAKGCKWPGYRCTVKHAAWDLQFGCQKKVGEAEYRRWEGVYAWGCLKMLGTFTNEEILGMKPYITCRWQWLAGPSWLTWLISRAVSHFTNLMYLTQNWKIPDGTELIWSNVWQLYLLPILHWVSADGNYEIWVSSTSKKPQKPMGEWSAWLMWNTCMNRHSEG